MQSNALPNAHATPNSQGYPVFLDLTGKTILVVGAGPVAARKLARLHEHACHIVVLSPACVPDVTEIIDKHASALWLKRWYSFEALEEVQPHLVLACTNDPSINQNIVEHCQRLGIFVNNATHRQFPGDMTIPSVIDLANQQLQLALSTGAQSPILTRYFRKQLATLLDTPETTRLLSLVAMLREELQHMHPDGQIRKAALHGVLDHPELATILSQDNNATRLEWGRQVLQHAVGQASNCVNG
jgi:precorrin-2 dehydrogenase / sirohydrochlorin ferrochelatase